MAGTATPRPSASFHGRLHAVQRRPADVATPGIVDLANLTGACLPFRTTEAARIAAGDGRPSLQSLYGDQAGCVAAVTTAANALVAERFLPRADAERRIQRARDTVVPP